MLNRIGTLMRPLLAMAIILVICLKGYAQTTTNRGIKVTSGKTYFLSSSTGHNPATGTMTDPFRDIAQVQALTLNGGDQVLFYNCDVWHERWALQASGQAGNPIQVSWYGPLSCGKYFTIDGSDVVSGWATVTTLPGMSSYTNTYYVASTATAFKAFVDGGYDEIAPTLPVRYISAGWSASGAYYVGDVVTYMGVSWLAIRPTQFANNNSVAPADGTDAWLRLSVVVTDNISAVNAVPNSLTSDGTNIYIHLLNNSNPATGHTIELSTSATRDSGIYGANRNYWTFDGVRIIRTGLSLNAAGGLVCRATLTNNNGALQECNGIVVQHSAFYNYLTPTTSGSGGGIYIGGYSPGTRTSGANYSGPSLVPPAGTVCSTTTQCPNDDLNPQGPITGTVIDDVYFGRADTLANLHYHWGGAVVESATGTIIRNSKFHVITAMGIYLSRYYYGAIGQQNSAIHNEIWDSEGGVTCNETPYCLVKDNYIHDFRGAGILLGGYTAAGDYSKAINNLIVDGTVSSDHKLYNGIDTNGAAAYLQIHWNKIRRVASSSFTAECVACDYDVVTDNDFDSTDATNFLGTAPTTLHPFEHLYISASAIQHIQLYSNRYIWGANSYVRMGFATPGDTSTRRSEAQFHAEYPGADAISSRPIDTCGGTPPTTDGYFCDLFAGTPVALGLGGQETVAFSATPTFNSVAYKGSYMVLTGNVSSITMADGLPGQEKDLLLCQDSTGGWTIPTVFSGKQVVNLTSTTLNTAANSCTTLTLNYWGGAAKWAVMAVSK